MKGIFIMDDKGYVSSMLTINFTLTEASESISKEEKDAEKGKRFDFCKAIAGDDKAMDPALLGILRSVYYLIKAKGEDPMYYVGELQKLVPKAEFNSTKIDKVKVSYGINRAIRMNGVCTFMDKYKLFDEKLKKSIENVPVKNAITAVSRKREALRELADFEERYVKLREGFDKPDTPFLLVKRYSEILQKNKAKVKAGKKIDLGNGEFFQQKTIGGKAYRVVKNVDNTISVTDEDGNAAGEKEQKALEQELLTNKIGKAGSLNKKTTVKKAEKADKTEKVKAATKAAPAKAERKEEKKEEQYDKILIKGDSAYKEEKFDKILVKGDEIREKRTWRDTIRKGETVGDTIRKKATFGDTLSVKEKKTWGDTRKKEEPKEVEVPENSPKLENSKEPENFKEPEKYVENLTVHDERFNAPESHFTPTFVKNKLQDIRTIFMTKCVKDKSAYKKAMTDPYFEANSAAWNNFFENDGGTEYKAMAAAMNDCIELLENQNGEDWNAEIKKAFSTLKKAADTYRSTHKSVLRFLGTSEHITKNGDRRMAATMKLLMESSVYESMISEYIDNGGKDKTYIEKGKEEAEADRLNGAMVQRNKYINHLLDNVLALSPSQKQSIIACASDETILTGKNGKNEEIPQKADQKALWYVAVSRLKKVMSGAMSSEDIEKLAANDFSKAAIKNEAANLQNNPAFKALLKASKSGKKNEQNDIHQQLMNMQGGVMQSEPAQNLNMNTQAQVKKLEQS
jgi:hypothetical protein